MTIDGSRLYLNYLNTDITCGVFKHHLAVQYLQSEEVVLLIKPAIVEE